MIQVAIMAPEQSRRNWLERRLRSEPSLRITGVVSTFALVRSLMSENVVDLAIVDETSELDSEMARDWLSELLDVLPVVLLCAEPDAWTFNQMVRAERGAILSRDASGEQIIDAVRTASSGLLVFDAALVPRPDLRDEVGADLTPRELQVLRFLAQGLANRDIANQLNISEHTIKFHIGSILGKLQASSRTEAVTRGLRSGLIEL